MSQSETHNPKDTIKREIKDILDRQGMSGFKEYMIGKGYNAVDIKLYLDEFEARIAGQIGHPISEDTVESYLQRARNNIPDPRRGGGETEDLDAVVRYTTAVSYLDEAKTDLTKGNTVKAGTLLDGDLTRFSKYIAADILELPNAPGLNGLDDMAKSALRWARTYEWRSQLKNSLLPRPPTTPPPTAT